MDRPTKTTSGRWKVGGDPKDPKVKWEGSGWLTEPIPGKKDIDQIAKWVEDMGDWCEMMHESMMELRERMLSVERLEVDLHHLSEVVKGLNPPRPPAARRPK
jgi:hypothetical protein